MFVEGAGDANGLVALCWNIGGWWNVVQCERMQVIPAVAEGSDGSEGAGAGGG